MKKGFTLAEVLITIAIVGVVAAMTLPTLIANINEKVSNSQSEVFEAKLIKGLNLTKIAGELNGNYSSTADFLENGLGRHLKITKICGVSNINDCIPYKDIKYFSEKSEKTISVDTIKTSKNLRLNDEFSDTASFVLGDGTFAIVSYNLKCNDDPDKADMYINSCLAGIYDINGNRKPNLYKIEIKNDKTVHKGDIHSFNGAGLGNCKGVINGLCIRVAAVNAYDQGSTLRCKLGTDLTPYFTSPDYPQLYKAYCEAYESHLASYEELKKIQTALDNNFSTTMDVLGDFAKRTSGNIISGDKIGNKYYAINFNKNSNKSSIIQKAPDSWSFGVCIQD